MKIEYIKPGTHLYKLATTDARYRQRWMDRYGLTSEKSQELWPWAGPTKSTKPIRRPVAVRQPDCFHRGPEVRRTTCKTCRGRTELFVFSCDVFGECTEHKQVPDVAATCNNCPKKNTYKPPFVRNLIYHLYPKKGNGVWQWNVQELLKRINLFDGKRVIAIVTDSSTDDPSLVKQAFAGSVHDFIVLPNDSKLREVVTFKALFNRVETHDPKQVTLYAHGKGVRHGMSDETQRTPQRWAEMIYESMLDYWPIVEQRLVEYPVVGSFKKVGRGFRESKSTWHYSGSWTWFRNRDMFMKDWEKIDNYWYGIEPYFSLHFPKEQAGVVFKEGIVGVCNDGNREHAMARGHLDLYDWKYCHVVYDEFQAWKQQNESSRMAISV
jgi:hypothetical protein